MSIYHNGKEYGATKVINYSASPDYNRGIAVNNIQTGNYQATDNGFLMIQLQSQQSNPTKVSVVRSKTPITDTGTEIASIVLSQYQYSETLTAQVMARDYYKLVIEGVGNPQVISCMFYPYASNVPIKLTEDISIGQVVGLEGELDGKQNAGDYATNTDLTNGLSGKQDKGDYATNTALNNGLATKQNKGNYFNKDKDILGVNNGGTGSTNINEARDNLEVLRYKYNESNKNFTNAPTGFATYYEAKDIPSNENLSCFSFTMYHSGTPVKGYAVQYYLAADSFTLYGRVRVGTESGYRAWKKLRNADGSIPADLIPPTVLKYTNDQGTWTETKLSDGTTMLEGWGVKTFNNLPNNTTKSAIITFPKAVDYTKSCVYAQGNLEISIQPPEMGNYYTNTNVSTNSFFISITNVSNKTALRAVIRWYIKGILA